MGFRALLPVAACALLISCSKVSQENFAQLRDGMTEQEVAAVLGSPDESNSVDVLGVSGTVSRWKSGDATITVRFVNGKLALKSFDKRPGAK